MWLKVRPCAFLVVYFCFPPSLQIDTGTARVPPAVQADLLFKVRVRPAEQAALIHNNKLCGLRHSLNNDWGSMDQHYHNLFEIKPNRRRVRPAVQAAQINNNKLYGLTHSLNNDWGSMDQHYHNLFEVKQN